MGGLFEQDRAAFPGRVLRWGNPIGFPGWCSGEESTCQCSRRKRRGFDPWVGKISWKRKWQSTLVFLLGESHGQRSLVGYSPWVHKELNMTEWLRTHSAKDPMGSVFRSSNHLAEQSRAVSWVDRGRKASFLCFNMMLFYLICWTFWFPQQWNIFTWNSLIRSWNTASHLKACLWGLLLVKNKSIPQLLFFLSGKIINAATCWQNLSVHQSIWSVILACLEYHIHVGLYPGPFRNKHSPSPQGSCNFNRHHEPAYLKNNEYP